MTEEEITKMNNALSVRKNDLLEKAETIINAAYTQGIADASK